METTHTECVDLPIAARCEDCYAGYLRERAATRRRKSEESGAIAIADAWVAEHIEPAEGSRSPAATVWDAYWAFARTLSYNNRIGRNELYRRIDAAGIGRRRAAVGVVLIDAALV